MYSKYDPKECPRCGKLHICIATLHCPCFDIELSESFLEYIAARFDECLCVDCIEELKNQP